MVGNRLDEFDVKIIEVLQQDARMDVTKIARLVNLSHTPVTERIRKLQEAGIITGYVALLDREKTRFPVMVILMIKLKDPNTQLFADFEEMVTMMPEVQSCYLISGNWNFILHVTAATPQEYAAWIFEKILCHSYIADVESAYLMRESKRFGPIPIA